MSDSFNRAIGFIDETDPKSPQAIERSELTDEEYEKLHERWLQFDPRLKLVISQPMAYVKFPDLDKPPITGIIINRDPGDETTALAQCPSTMEIADSVSSGWSGPLGDEVRCELSEGHEGDHQCIVKWDDLMATSPINMDEEERKRQHWAYHSGPDTLAGNDDL